MQRAQTQLTRLQRAQLQLTRLQRAQLQLTRLQRAQLQLTRLQRTRLRLTRLRRAQFVRGSASGCRDLASGRRIVGPAGFGCSRFGCGSGLRARCGPPDR
ncbi:pentapeptide repeat-containing protein [Actinoplanes subglobosus]|uniref:Pentapeptide repeat-containing protein n=1 Tax=Actinoplanes subglobosus TaxID=1547892 RepID=A0ABV8IJ16_9ACTN